MISIHYYHDRSPIVWFLALFQWFTWRILKKRPKSISLQEQKWSTAPSPTTPKEFLASGFVLAIISLAVSVYTLAPMIPTVILTLAFLLVPVTVYWIFQVSGILKTRNIGLKTWVWDRKRKTHVRIELERYNRVIRWLNPHLPS